MEGAKTALFMYTRDCMLTDASTVNRYNLLVCFVGQDMLDEGLWK